MHIETQIRKTTHPLFIILNLKRNMVSPYTKDLPWAQCYEDENATSTYDNPKQHTNPRKNKAKIKELSNLKNTLSQKVRLDGK